MSIYAGLDVSDKTTHICVVNGGGAVAGYGDRCNNPQIDMLLR